MKLSNIYADDIFISYCRSDGTTFTDGLANELTQKGFTCFTDALGTDAGKELPQSLIRKLDASKMMVVVGSPDAAGSTSVAKEIECFCEINGTSSIIVIDFDEAVSKAIWQNLVVGLRREKDQAHSLITGNPRPAIVNRIEKAFSYRKSKDRLRVYIRSAISVLMVLLATIAVASIVAAKQIKTAKEATLKAAQYSLLADKARTLADEKAKMAAVATRRADSANARAIVAAKNQQVAETKMQDAFRKEMAASQAGKMQLELAKSLQLANESQLKLQDPESVLINADKAIQSMQIVQSTGQYSYFSNRVLQSALELVPDFIDSKSKYHRENNNYLSVGEEMFHVEFLDTIIQYFRKDESRPLFQLAVKGGLNLFDVERSSQIGKSGKYIAICFADSLRLYKTADKTYKACKTSGTGLVHSTDGTKVIAVGPGGKYVVQVDKFKSISGNDNDSSIINIWDTEQNRSAVLLNTIVNLDDVAFSENENAFIAGGHVDGRTTVFIWDEKGIENYFQEKHADKFTQITLPVPLQNVAILNPSCFATSIGTQFNTNTTIWNLNAYGKSYPTCYIPTGGPVMFGSDNRIFIDRSGSIETWKYSHYRDNDKLLAPGEEIEEIAYDGQNNGIRILLRKSDSAAAKIIFWGNKKDLRVDIDYHSEEIISYTPDLTYILTRGDSIHLWNRTTLINSLPLEVKSNSIEKFAVSNDERFMALVEMTENTKNRTVTVFKIQNDKWLQISAFTVDSSWYKTGQLSFNANATLLILLEKNGDRIIIRDINKSSTVKLPIRNLSAPESYYLSPRGNFVGIVERPAADENNCYLQIVNVKTGAIVLSKKLPEFHLFEWSSDEKNILINYSRTGKINLLHVFGDKKVRDIAESANEMVDEGIYFTFSPSGKYFGIIAGEDILKIFDSKSGREVNRIYGTGGHIIFSDDDKYVYLEDFLWVDQFQFFFSNWFVSPLDVMKEGKRRLKKIVNHLCEGLDPHCELRYNLKGINDK